MYVIVNPILVNVNEIETIDSVFKLEKSVLKLFIDEQKKLPYHINILDILWANENAHSRIFSELIKQNSDGKFEILQSFFEFLREKKTNFNPVISLPQITSEKDRIDLLVLERDYAIIIENKIHNAVDQKGQIARYIEIVRNRGIKDENIFLIYLTSDGSKTVSEQSWIIEENNFQDRFQDRFFEISFKHDILPWLKIFVLPNCKIKDVYLKSTIEQYIDYLEGFFNIRKINDDMNNEIEKFIITELNLNSTPEQNYLKVSKKIEDFSKTQNQLDNIKNRFQYECFTKWLEKIKIDFPELSRVEDFENSSYPKVGVLISYKDFTISLVIEIGGNEIYYGASIHGTSEIIEVELTDVLKDILIGFKRNQWWYGWKYTSIENAYSELKVLIQDVLSKINK